MEIWTLPPGERFQHVQIKWKQIYITNLPSLHTLYHIWCYIILIIIEILKLSPVSGPLSHNYDRLVDFNFQTSLDHYTNNLKGKKTVSILSRAYSLSLCLIFAYQSFNQAKNLSSDLLGNFKWKSWRCKERVEWSKSICMKETESFEHTEKDNIIRLYGHGLLITFQSPVLPAKKLKIWLRGFFLFWTDDRTEIRFDRIALEGSLVKRSL